MEDWQFVLSVSIFTFFMVQIGSLAGQTIIKNAPPVPIMPSAIGAPSGLEWAWFIFNLLVFVFSNIIYFFQLMSISSDFALFGVVVLTPLGITMLWIIIKTIINIKAPTVVPIPV